MTLRQKFLLYRRYLAFAFDFVMTLAGGYLVFDLIFMKFFKFSQQDISAVWGIVTTILLIVRDISGKSLGKKIFGLKIVSQHGYEQPRLNQLVLRNLFIFLIPIECILVIISKDHLRIGDHMAKTRVVDKNQIGVMYDI